MAHRLLPLGAAPAFALVTDFARHGRWIPLTRMDAPPRPARVGDAVVARSAGFFVDRMVVERLDPPVAAADDPSAKGRPGVAVLRKLGPVLLGTATIVVTPAGEHAAAVRWGEDVWLRGPLPRALTRAVLAPFLDAMTALALWRIDRSLRRR